MEDLLFELSTEATTGRLEPVTLEVDAALHRKHDGTWDMVVTISLPNGIDPRKFVREFPAISADEAQKEGLKWIKQQIIVHLQNDQVFSLAKEGWTPVR